MTTRKVLFLLSCALYLSLAYFVPPIVTQTFPPLRVRETDGSPNIPAVREIRVTNGTLTLTASGIATIATGGGGSGASTALDNLAAVSINTSLLAQTGVDVGSTTKPFRDLYLFGSGTFATTYLKLTGTPTSTRTVTFPDASITVARTDAAQTFTGDQTLTSASQLLWSTDLILGRAGAANLRHGAVDAAVPVAQIDSVQNVVSGTSNTAGANRTFAGSQSTGNAAGGSIIFQTSPLGGSGSTPNGLVTALTIAASGIVTIPTNLTVSSTNGFTIGSLSAATRIQYNSPDFYFLDTSNNLANLAIKTITNYGGTAARATAGMGVIPIYSAPAISATKTANFTVLSYTPPATAGVYRVSAVITTTSSTNTGTVQATLDYVDSQGTTHTADVIPLIDAAGVVATTKTGASKEFHTTDWQFTINNAATAIALKVVITGSVSYTVTGSIEQIQ